MKKAEANYFVRLSQPMNKDKYGKRYGYKTYRGAVRSIEDISNTMCGDGSAKEFEKRVAEGKARFAIIEDKEGNVVYKRAL